MNVWCLPVGQQQKERKSMNDKMMRQEIAEAIDAGERALYSLNAAAEKLGSARNWGLVDLFGGGFITDLIKHSKMRDATGYIEEAKRDLKIFQRELRDVRVPTDIRLDVGDFLTFADFFFDGLVADYMVQSRIAEARREVEDAVSRVQYLLMELKQLYGQEVY